MFSALLVASLFGVVLSTVAGRTIMNNHYLEDKLTSANAYSRLSTALVAQVTEQPELGGNPQAASVVSSVITPAMLQKIINAAIDQLTLYYQGKGPAPSIDLTGLTSQLQTVGVPIPMDSTLTKPVRLVPDSGTNQTIVYPGRSFANARTIAITATVVLVLALLAVSWARHVWTPLPDAVITVGVLTGLVAAACAAGSSLIARYVRFDDASNAFAAVGRDLATAIAHDLMWRFGAIAVVLLLGGIGTRIWAGRLGTSSKSPAPLTSRAGSAHR